ncbi:hypothetical protein ACIQFP_01800 [Nocardiopsis alba]
MIYLLLGLLREALAPKWAPLECYNCGATVDSRAPGCWNCKIKF